MSMADGDDGTAVYGDDDKDDGGDSDSKHQCLC